MTITMMEQTRSATRKMGVVMPGHILAEVLGEGEVHEVGEEVSRLAVSHHRLLQIQVLGELPGEVAVIDDVEGMALISAFRQQTEVLVHPVDHEEFADEVEDQHQDHHGEVVTHIVTGDLIREHDQHNALDHRRQSSHSHRGRHRWDGG